MWKKEENPTPTAAPRPEASPRPEPLTPQPRSAERATIGRSITIRGEVTGDEDLLIQGRVDGSVDLKQHSVTVGSEGDVKASIIGRVVTVEGRVEGNINADEQVILRSSAWVQGDITAPRVVLEDGARFRGGVDMGESADRGRGNASSSQPRRTPEPAKPNTPAAQESSGSEAKAESGSPAKVGG
jgi:cytoskeletal protein CcmA (bactofilin family)